MSKGKRIGLALLAWIVCHFALYIAFGAVGNTNPPRIFIGIVDLCVAFIVFSLTGKKSETIS
jgi:uncharacterized membrane protein YbhN (UPF0104 family)